MALIIMVTAVFGSLYALLGDSGLVAVMRMRSRAELLRYEINDKARDNQDLRDTIKPLRDGDPDAIERIAREKLFWVRPGDTLFVLPPEITPPAATLPVPVESASPTAPSLPRRR